MIIHYVLSLTCRTNGSVRMQHKLGHHLQESNQNFESFYLPILSTLWVVMHFRNVIAWFCSTLWMYAISKLISRTASVSCCAMYVFFRRLILLTLNVLFNLKGCIELLKESGIAIAGKRAVVVGRSNIVGMPVALMLNNRDATVTIVHSRTKNPEAIIREADIVIAAAGQPLMVRVLDLYQVLDMPKSKGQSLWPTTI